MTDTIIRPRPATTREKRPSSGYTPASAPLMSKVVVGLILLVTAIYSLAPVWWLLVTATKNKGYLFSTNGFWFSHFDLWNNVQQVFAMQGGLFGLWMLNSALYSVLGAAAGTALSVMAGYALAKYRFRGKNAAFNIILAAVLVPAPMFALPLYLMFTSIGIVNTFWAVFLPSIVSPFGVYLSRVYASASVPDEMIEAARLDGAREAGVFWRIAVPVMTPALVTIFLFQFVGIWNNYLLPAIMLSDSSLQPITVGLAAWRSQFNNGVPYNVTITGALLSIIPLVIAFLCLQRFWRAGLAAGSVK
ncbi:carbohydrate ABC transporter permease [Planctomonas sp. JC2975]|uniref:carbohydrate ABC transporter permease n=1 Tax=Planctomonas sp. JC2975 TaxID=2729626 RepID=UPI0014764489|nr:carbohydrate ABC transporter permease [Planctomonas sp. JC2975]NNC14026.1 carbohydrate ABC transporter permease [Planctomonas sp. JC2975]